VGGGPRQHKALWTENGGGHTGRFCPKRTLTFSRKKKKKKKSRTNTREHPPNTYNRKIQKNYGRQNAEQKRRRIGKPAWGGGVNETKMVEGEIQNSRG